MTVEEKLAVAVVALESIAAAHLPLANTKKYWAGKTIINCIEVLANDTDIARHTLIELGVK